MSANNLMNNEPSEMSPEARAFRSGLLVTALGSLAYAANIAQDQAFNRVGAYASALTIGVGVFLISNATGSETINRDFE